MIRTLARGRVLGFPPAPSEIMKFTTNGGNGLVQSEMMNNAPNWSCELTEFIWSWHRLEINLRLLLQEV